MSVVMPRMVHMETTTFTLASGRVVGVTEFGDPLSDRVVVFAHAAPGASQFDPDPAVTAARDVRVIALDRAGYGRSEPLDDGPPSVARSAADISEYLAAQGIGPTGGGGATVGAAGWSAGGRIALALAAAHPHLIERVALVGTPAPDTFVPWVGDDNRAMLESWRGMPLSSAVDSLKATFDGFAGAAPSGESQLPQLANPEVDGDVLVTARDRLVGMLDDAMLQGNVGVATDIVSYTLMDLGFDPVHVAQRTLLLYGAKDPIGNAHASWYRSHLVDARVEMVPDRGHLLIVPLWDRVLSHLAPGSKR